MNEQSNLTTRRSMLIGFNWLTPVAIGATLTFVSTDARAEDYFIDDGDVSALISAVNAANSNDEPDTIHLAEDGHYLLEIAADNGWGGNGLPRIESEITIDGNGATIERSSEDGTPNFRFFFLESSTDAELTLINLTLHNGLSTHGGAIRNWGNSLTLIGCTLSNNASTGSATGGAIHSDSGGHIAISGSTLIGNTSHRGGAINKHGSGGSLIITDSVITNNVSTGTNGGGGLYIESSGTHSITGTTISGNLAAEEVSWSHGGGIRTNSATLTLVDCTISGNINAGGNGGGIYSGGTLHISGTTVSDNSAQGSGGGIRTESSLHMTNCTVSGNSAASNGGGLLIGGAANVRNSTIADNTAEGQGAGIWAGTALSMSNSIVAYNSGGSDVHNGFTDVGYNIVEDGGGISEKTSMSGDPMLGPLADNGGPTMTHALLPGSPALVNGDCTGGVVTEDQRGMPRPQCNACDIGAFEFDGLPSFGDLNCDGAIDVFDLLILLGAWGQCADPADCSADLNGSEAVDVFDLLILLGSWG